MKYCTHCGAELLDEAVICPKCGCAIGKYTSAEEADQSSHWNILCVIGFAFSFFAALVGLILSIVGRKQVMQSGEKGKDLATAGIIISSVNLALTILYVICGFALLIYFMMTRVFPVPLQGA